MKRFARTFLVFSGFVFGGAGSGAADSDHVPAGAITGEEFQDLHASLQPTGEEVWLTIPWETSVLEAQAWAGAERKPLFIWAMDGHPLGCT